MSHDFNRDPEIIECRKRFGDWIGYAWQECLSIADRNDGIVPGTVRQIAEILAPISLQKYLKYAANSAQTFLEYAANLGWIVIRSDHIQILNYGKYHRIEERKPAPPRPDLTRPNLYKKKDRNLSSIPKPKKTPYPENFNPSEGLRIWYSKQRVDDIQPHVEAFRDYHISRASRFLDWEAAFRTWVRNIGRFNGKPQVQKDGELSDRIQRALRRGL